MEALCASALRLAAPLLIAALGELWVERSGVVNIGVEGMMLVGAFAAFAAAVATGSPSAGILAGAAAGALMGVLFAVFAVLRAADQIVVGTAINLLSLGATGLALQRFYGGSVPMAPHLPELSLGPFAALPFAGPVFFRQSAFVYAAFLLCGLVAFWQARTRSGLRMRAVGELARAADVEGVSVPRTRFAAIAVGAALAGLAGAALTVDQAPVFAEEMTAGRGFIALAIVIFGRWKPFGVLAASLFFGAALALQFRLQAQGVGLPYTLLLTLPYLVTLVALAFAAGRARAPADLGRPYVR